MATVFNSSLKTGLNSGIPSESTVLTVGTRKRVNVSAAGLTQSYKAPGVSGQTSVIGARFYYTTKATGIANETFTVTVGTTADADKYASITVSADDVGVYTATVSAVEAIQAHGQTVVTVNVSAGVANLAGTLFVDYHYED